MTLRSRYPNVNSKHARVTGMGTDKGCKVEGCDRPHGANGWCDMHNARVWRTGSTELTKPVGPQKCIYEGCERLRVAWGYCATHHARIKRHGSPDVVLRSGRTRSGAPTLLSNGYLMEYNPEHPLGGAQILQHRRVLYDAIGPGSHSCHLCGAAVTWGAERPDRLIVDHLDRNRANNDPANLRPICDACSDRQGRLSRTHCIHGHELSSENTYRDPRGHRRCRTCIKEQEQRRVRHR